MKKSIYTRENDKFLEELRRIRLEADMSQIELAKKLRSTQSIVSKVERGERRIDVVELWRWLNALGASLPVFAKRLDDRLGGKKR